LVRTETSLERQRSILGGTTKRILVPAVGLILVYHVLFALSLANERCLDDMLPAPNCRVSSSLWVNPLTDAATLTAPSSAAFGVEDRDMAAAFRVGFDFVASNVAEKKLNDSARKYFDLYAMVLPYRVMVEEKDASVRPRFYEFILKAMSVSRVQDSQGHFVYFTEARSNDGKDFVLVCNTRWANCPPGLKTLDNFTFTVLQPGDSNYVNDYAAVAGTIGNGVVVTCKGEVNGVKSDYVFALVKQKDFKADAARQYFDVYAPSPPERTHKFPNVNISIPNRPLDVEADHACAVDFRNVRMFRENDNVFLKDGMYEEKDQNTSGSEQVRLDHVFCFNRGTIEEYALVVTDWIGCGASCSSEGIVQLFVVRAKRPVITQQFVYDSDALGTGATFDEDSLTLTITGRSDDESPHCCPESLDVTTYRWRGTKFEEQGYEHVPAPQR
jgi:hypothetical protein